MLLESAFFFFFLTGAHYELMIVEEIQEGQSRIWVNVWRGAVGTGPFTLGESGLLVRSSGCAFITTDNRLRRESRFHRLRGHSAEGSNEDETSHLGSQQQGACGVCILPFFRSLPRGPPRGKASARLRSRRFPPRSARLQGVPLRARERPCPGRGSPSAVPAAGGGAGPHAVPAGAAKVRLRGRGPLLPALLPAPPRSPRPPRA